MKNRLRESTTLFLLRTVVAFAFVDLESSATARRLCWRTVHNNLTARAAVIVTLSLALAGAVQAQFSVDYQTNTISAVKSNWSGTFYNVGSNTMFDTLRIINGGVLSNGSCVIGWADGGSNNTVVVSDTGSAMSNRFELYLGNDGAFNRLVITNRGLVSSGHGYLGLNQFGTQNVALVSDTGSVWRVKTNLFVGYVDGANQLIASNGAVVSDQLGMIGSNANLNAAWVTGPGSMWSNAASLYVGFIGSENELLVTNGGFVWAGNAFIGEANISHNNMVTVVGSGSVWHNTNFLFVGYIGSSNSLVVASGGVVQAFEIHVGEDSHSSNNLALITGSGALLSNSADTIVGQNGYGNQMIISNGATVLDQVGDVGFTNPSSANVAWVTGTGSVWSNTIDTYIGFNSAGNQLHVDAGGAVFDPDTFIGAFIPGSNNIATLTGSGSRWNNTGYLYVGEFGSSNTLAIADGAAMNVGLETRIGFQPSSSNNMLTVTGTGALLSNTVNTIVGYAGPLNRLVISNSAVVWDQAGIIGYTNSGVRNLAILDNSVWSNTVIFHVGYKGAFNQLIVSNIADLFTLDGYIGTFAGASNNTATITGNGSVWQNSDSMNVGDSGVSNMLVVAAGGQVSDQFGYLGYLTSGSNNQAIVTGIGSLWSNTDNFVVGNNGSGNQLVIADGGTVYDASGGAGLIGPASQNHAVVTGSGASWINTSYFYVGYSGAVNQVTITNGGAVFSPNSEVGAVGISSNDILTVTGAGSSLRSTNNMTVGAAGAHNVMNIIAGGVVSNTYGYLGGLASAGTNSVLVTGSGSLWTNATGLVVGTASAGNSLVISNGGVVNVGSYSEVGYAATAGHNSVLVTGTNSAWVNTSVFVGVDGASNTVTIAHGARAAGIFPNSSSVYLGNSFDSISNTVLVTDPGSSWSAEVFYVGLGSRSNSFTIANGGTVDCFWSYVGYDNGTNNSALVTGDGSRWQNIEGIFVGYGGSRNSLVVSNGGVVSGSGGMVGYVGTAGVAGGFSNSVLITGAGSAWSNENSSTLYVGYDAHGNSLTVNNGGAIVGNLGFMGYADSTGNDGSNNVGVVTGTGSLWSNTGTFTVGDGSHSNRLTVALAGKLTGANIFVGARGGINNLLRLTNGVVQANTIIVNTNNYLTGAGTVTGRVLNNGTITADINGARLTFNSFVQNNGALRASGGGIIEFFGPVLNFGTTNFTGGSAIYHAGFLTTTGSTNSWNFAGDGLWETSARWSRAVPPSSADSLVLITNATAKTVTVTASTFSAAPTSVNNYSIALDGPANVTNTLRIADTPGLFTAIYFSVGTNAVMTISNATVLAGAFGIGAFSVSGELRVEEGAQLDTTSLATCSVANATISGVWNNNALNIAPNSQVSVTDGGELSINGVSTLDSNVIASVTGSNSTMYVSSTLTVGSNTPGNQLTVAGAAGFRCDGVAYLGFNSSSSNNLLTITGSGSSMYVSNTMVIGLAGPNNQVTVAGGAHLTTPGGLFLYGSNNIVTVSGSGSVWSNANELFVGDKGTGNQLTITNGAKMIDSSTVFTFVGNGAGTSNNTVTITGTNSVWQELHNVRFVITQSGNRLLIADGGSMTVPLALVSGGTNTATVTGSGSVWNTGSGLIVNGFGTQLIVSNGGAVFGVNNTVGPGPNNVAIVAGANSLWSTTGTLTVGTNVNSTANSLEIDGGTVAAIGGVIIGFDGTNNLIHLAGGALVVTNSAGTAPLVVSASGGLDSLILDGGSVTVDSLIVTNGLNSVVTFNVGTINSKAAFVTNAQQFVVGDGANTATYHLLGGTHSFNDGIRVRNASFLTGCGTINGSILVDTGGTVLADCGGTLTFTGTVTNNGTMRAINGRVLEFYGPFVNNGIIDLINGGTTNFHSSFINNGVVLDASSVQVAQTAISGDDFVVQIQSVVGHTYQLQVTDSLPPSWTDTGASQSGTGGLLVFTDPAGMTNSPGRFYQIRVSAP